ncbi:hypothetical protein [Spirulina sp. 06S082]|uniref:hypothetical protein n=1 Tax=Spirulina sp. 06S082 TaxID=3110248 RepID=UPI002B1FDDDA|nr:hypothetical protein [Spirulina sp. 06S082]MEA5467708.1 hypothetical protein [Spirulina sp. 06S082]
MAQITLEIPDEFSERLAEVDKQYLSELLVLSLQQPIIATKIYHYVLDFLVSQPTPEEIAAFRPTPEMQERLRTLLSREKAGNLSAIEQKELDEYERLEHLIVMIKSGNLPYLVSAS